jgi:hypothetical protein
MYVTGGNTNENRNHRTLFSPRMIAVLVVPKTKKM